MEKRIITFHRFSSAFIDLVILALITIVLLIFSYFFNAFIFLVKLFQKYPESITYIDEIVTLLLTLSIGLAVFSWRRWRELQKETRQRIKFQEELIALANTRAETERIISKQLHCEIELHKLEEKRKSNGNFDKIK
jgi:membrane protein implicated in regulation of membrane protease activity